MKVLLAAVNAKYIHSNPAVYSLKAYVERELGARPGIQIEIGEYTINNQPEQILQDIFRRKPDFVGFSCYIWNISQVLSIAEDLKKVLPRVEIWLGGPEVSYDAGKLLGRAQFVRGVMRGEGELIFSRLLRAYQSCGFPERLEEDKEKAGEEAKEKAGEEAATLPDMALLDGALGEVPGITWRRCYAPFGKPSVTGLPEHGLAENPPAPLLSMDDIPFYYENMGGFENRIVYYESSRGCPFSCSYCLSSIDKSVRFRSLSLVERELQFFLEQKVPQVKFVDRTFNCKKEHTMGIWRYLLAHDNGVTNFHFEVSADLFDEEELELISRMRPGLIQLEIGVQSVNPHTIREIRRHMNLAKLSAAVAKVRSFGNTHQHLDLIAGLPWENMESFLYSFDEVYRMEPDQLQLGFLKVLKGSYMENQTENYGLLYRSAPPYEVLATNWLSYEDVSRLKEMEEMVEVHYNSGQFLTVLPLLLKEFSRPSSLYLALASYYRENGLFGVSHNRLARYEILYRFCCGRAAGERKNPVPLSQYRDALMTDLYLRENLKTRPSFASDQTPHKAAVRRFFEREEKERRFLPAYGGYEARQLAKMAHLEVLEDGRALLFDYKSRSPLTGNAAVMELPATWREEL